MTTQLKSWIDRNGLSMYALAKMCNVSRVTIKNLVDGRFNPSRRTANKLIRMTRSMKDPITQEMLEKGDKC
jgi:DNA-binding XRE family transcriptional regulator